MQHKHLPCFRREREGKTGRISRGVFLFHQTKKCLLLLPLISNKPVSSCNIHQVKYPLPHSIQWSIRLCSVFSSRRIVCRRIILHQALRTFLFVVKHWILNNPGPCCKVGIGRDLLANIWYDLGTFVGSSKLDNWDNGFYVDTTQRNTGRTFKGHGMLYKLPKTTTCTINLWDNFYNGIGVTMCWKLI